MYQETRRLSVREETGQPQVTSRVMNTTYAVQSSANTNQPTTRSIVPEGQVITSAVPTSRTVVTSGTAPSILSPGAVVRRSSVVSTSEVVRSSRGVITSPPVSNVDVYKRSPLAGMRVETDYLSAPRLQSRFSYHEKAPPASHRQFSVTPGSVGASMLSPIKPGAFQVGATPEGLDADPNTTTVYDYPGRPSGGKRYRLMKRQPGACATCNACCCGSCDRPNGCCAGCNSDGRCDRGGRYLAPSPDSMADHRHRSRAEL